MVRFAILDWIQKKLARLSWHFAEPADVEVKPTGKSKVILTLVDSDVFDLLTNYALDSGLEISEVVERAVKQYCRQRRGVLSEYF
jgi:hypothetical protein